MGYIENKPRRHLINPDGLSQKELQEASRIELYNYTQRRTKHIEGEFQGNTHGRRLIDLLPDVDRIADSVEMLFKTFEVVDVYSVSYDKDTPCITIRIPDVRFRCRSYVNYGEIFIQYQMWQHGIELHFYNTVDDYDGSKYFVPAYHPHITDGRACLGSWETGIKQALNTADLFAISRQVRKFVNSYYGRSTYTHADYYRTGHRRQIFSSYAVGSEYVVIRDVKYHVRILTQRVRQYSCVQGHNTTDYEFVSRIKDIMVEFHCSMTQAVNILYRFVQRNAAHSHRYFEQVERSPESSKLLRELGSLINGNGTYAKVVIPTVVASFAYNRYMTWRLPDTSIKRLNAISRKLSDEQSPITQAAKVATLDTSIIKSCIWDDKKKAFKKLCDWKISDEIFKEITEPPNTKELEDQAELEISRARKLITREMYKYFSKLAKGAFDEANNIDAPATASQLSFETLS